MRRPATDDPERYVSHFVVVADRDDDANPTSVGLLADEQALIRRLETELAHDLRFEHLAEPVREIREFIRDCLHDRDADQVEPFITRHGQQPATDTCFIPVLNLTVATEITVGSLRLLPADSTELPITPSQHLRAIAAVPVIGTDTNAMVDRARVVAERELRRLRIALREDKWVHEAQLRFRLGPQFALASGPSGWVAPGDVAWDLELYDDLIQTVTAQQVIHLPDPPSTKLNDQVDLALTWIEAAYFAPDPVVQAVNLCIALEALLGRKDDKEKGRGLAMRRAVLGKVASGGFAHPGRIFTIYDQVRSTAVHGEIAPTISRGTVTQLAFDIRRAVDETLTFARAHNLPSRKAVLKALKRQDQWDEVANWLRQLHDPDWNTYLDRLKDTT